VTHFWSADFARVLGVLLTTLRRYLESQSILLGQIFETFVVTEVRKAEAWSARDLRLSHFRSHAGREVIWSLRQGTDGCAGLK